MSKDSLIFLPTHEAYIYPELNASPAPTESIGLTTVASDLILSSQVIANAPLSPFLQTRI